MHMVDATAGPAATMNTAGMYAEPRITMKNAGQIPAGETYMHFFTHWNGPFAEAAPMQPSIQEILWDEEGRMPEVEQEDRGVKHGCSYDGRLLIRCYK